MIDEKNVGRNKDSCSAPRFINMMQVADYVYLFIIAIITEMNADTALEYSTASAAET
ncbi:hypothetical protein EDD99_8171 [Streptomyces sp. 846.5]|nr:hypothetical protein [Streptomyces sp. 846.5]TDT93292.1 hypothetical protein EDD99_8101 [Streptomyces sp. 846.5]TDT93361.1 hypothetical protein EDD99_8171 [Streptomyces sp. 846.5]